jgi:hypothetical protein
MLEPLLAAGGLSRKPGVVPETLVVGGSWNAFDVPVEGSPGTRPCPGSDTVPVSRDDLRPDGLPRLTAVPAARSRAAVLKVRFWAVFGALVFSSAVGIFAAVSFLTFKPPVVDVDATKPLGLAVAELAAHDFVTGGALRLPTVPGQDPTQTAPIESTGPLAWQGFSRYRLPNGTPVESHRFLFYRTVQPATPPPTGASVRPVYQLMELSVLVAVPPDTNPILAARPYMEPAVFADAELVTDLTDFRLAAPLPDTALDQIRSWAQAWAADDSEKLKLITGDQTARVRYVGLGGYSLAEIRILSAAKFADDTFLARVRIVLGGANESILEMDMDLTITAASTGLPKVSGWGPAGSGLRTPADVRVSEGL